MANSGLAGVVAIVTGAADGEGLAAAEGLLQAGARVAMWDDRVGILAEARDELVAEGLTPHPQEVDVADFAQVEQAYRATCAALGAIDLLVNHATLKNSFMMGPENQRPYRSISMWNLDLERFRRATDVNFLGAYLTSRAVVRDMIARRRGLIINTSTQAPTQRSPEHLPYGPTKAAIDAFSAAAAQDLAPHGVRVNVIGSGGQVNRRGERDPHKEPYDWMMPLIRYLWAREDVTGQVLHASQFDPAVAAPVAKGATNAH